MKSQIILIGIAAVLGAVPAAVIAAQEPPPCDCDCPSLEEQVEKRLSDYKEKLDAEVEELRDGIKDQISQQRVDELKDKIERLFDDMLKDFREQPQSPPKEVEI